MAQCALDKKVESIPQGISARGKAQQTIIHEKLPTPILTSRDFSSRVLCRTWLREAQAPAGATLPGSDTIRL
jgi:hypothetical protein